MKQNDRADQNPSVDETDDRDARDDDGESRRLSPFAMIRRLPESLRQLARDEVGRAVEEVKTRIGYARTGIILLAGAAVIGLALVFTIVGAGIAALALVLPLWASALIVAAVLAVVTGVLGAVGSKLVKRGAPPVPRDSIARAKTTITEGDGS